VSGERQISERERGDVVPACKILGVNNRASARPEHTPGLFHEMVETFDVLDHLIGVDDVERGTLERPRVVEISRTNVEAACASQVGAVGDDLLAVDVACRYPEPVSYGVRPRAIIAADIQQARRRTGYWKSFEKPPAIRRFSVGPKPRH
jgi:hypothetical protein